MPKTVVVDQSEYIFLAISVTPKVDLDGVQKVDSQTKTPQWSVECLIEEPGDIRAKSEVIKVTITSPDTPALPKYSELEFGRLRQGSYAMAQKDRETREMTGINDGQYWSADNVRVKPTSVNTNGTKPKVEVTASA